MVNPRVTVLMPVYDPPPDMLDTAIASVLGQTLTNLEFLILNDGGRDERVRARLQSWASKDNRVRLFDEPHRGVPGASNRGLGIARGEYVARQDADDWSEPHRLERQAAFLDSHPRVALAGADSYSHLADGTPLWRLRLPHSTDELSRALWLGNPFVHGSTMFRREQALQIGGYREQLPGASDYDFLWRLTESGGAVNLEEVLYHYRYTSGSISARRAADQARIRRVAQVLAATRQRGQPEDIPAALEGGQSASDAFRAALKQADHFMLAGNFPGARKAYLHLLQSHPWSGLGWAKLFRLAVFVAIPPARESCFRRTSAPSLQRAAASPRVLFVMPGNGQGSSMIFARRQAQSVVREGLEVHLFHLASRTSPRLLIAELHRFRSELARVRPAVVHAHFGTVTALFSALASGSLPLVITYRGSDLNSPPRSYRWQDKLRAVCGCVFSQLAALRAQRIICVSRQLRNHLWWRRGVVTILPTGVDADEFYPKPRALARERLGWTDVERVVLFNAGGDPRVKRLDLAKAAVDRGRRELPELRLEILDGSVLPERLPELMNAADCLLLTSVSEGSPTVVQEALACDLPVVSVAVGDVVERLEGVRNSTVSSSDAAVLGDALVSIVEPPRRSNGSLKIDEFSSRRLAAELKQIYLRLAGT